MAAASAAAVAASSDSTRTPRSRQRSSALSLSSLPLAAHVDVAIPSSSSSFDAAHAALAALPWNSTLLHLLPSLLRRTPLSPHTLVPFDASNHPHVTFRIVRIQPRTSSSSLSADTNADADDTAYRIDGLTTFALVPDPTTTTTAATATARSSPQLPPLAEWTSRLIARIHGYNDLVTSVLRSMHIAMQRHSTAPTVYLFHGLSGTGKTVLLDAIAETSTLPTFPLHLTELFQRELGESESLVRRAFARAREASDATRTGSFILLDNIDSLASSSSSSTHSSSSMGKDADGEDESNDSSRVDDDDDTDPHSLETRLLHTLRDELDTLDRRSRAKRAPVFVLMASSSLQRAPPTLVLHGRTHRSILLAPPTPPARLELLAHFCSPFVVVEDGAAGVPASSSSASSSPSALARVNDMLHGFVGADIEKLCREVFFRVVQQHRPDDLLAVSTPSAPSPSSFIPPTADPPTRRLIVRESDFHAVLRHLRPANLALHEYRLPPAPRLASSPSSPPRSDARIDSLFDSPHVAHLAGLDHVLARLNLAIMMPLRRPSEWRALHRRVGIQAPSGVLLYGPPGTGKTALAHALARTCALNPLCVSAATLVSKVVGESEKNIQNLFALARASAPCMIVLDQIDSLGARREGMEEEEEGVGGVGGGASSAFDRVLSTLLIELDGVHRKARRGLVGGSDADDADALSLLPDVLVVATTSAPHMLDPALLRPGRLDMHLCLRPPDVRARFAILRSLTSAMPVRVEPAHRRLCREWEEEEEEEEEEASDGVDDDDGDGDDDGIVDLLMYLAISTNGCSGADLTGLCREAAMSALRSSARSLFDGGVDALGAATRAADASLSALCVSSTHFLDAMRSTTPSLRNARMHHPFGGPPEVFDETALNDGLDDDIVDAGAAAVDPARNDGNVGSSASASAPSLESSRRAQVLALRRRKVGGAANDRSAREGPL